MCKCILYTLYMHIYTVINYERFFIGVLQANRELCVDGMGWVGSSSTFLAWRFSD